jgi:CRP-like cAMP-binding protein
MHAPQFSENLLLATLTTRDASAFLKQLKLMSLPIGTVVQEDESTVDFVYFPTTGMISLLAAMADGQLVETSLVGREGIVNSFAGLGISESFNRAVMQVSGLAYRSELPAFKKILKSNLRFRDRIDRYHAFLLAQSQQTAACNLLHPLDARLCRWLAQVRDRVGADSFDLTQEFIAQMLGVTRPTVNLALNRLKSKGMIKLMRGAVHVADAEKLKRGSCECYELLAKKMAKII